MEHFNVVEDMLSGLLEGLVSAATDPFSLEQVEEAFGNRIVVAVNASAHRMFNAMGPQK